MMVCQALMGDRVKVSKATNEHNFCQLLRSINMELIVSDKLEAFNLNEEQTKELLNLTGDFLAKYFSKEVISTLKIDIKISPKPEPAFLSLTAGCVYEKGADDPRCPLDYAWR
jgi:hypothetical protein